MPDWLQAALGILTGGLSLGGGLITGYGKNNGHAYSADGGGLFSSSAQSAFSDFWSGLGGIWNDVSGTSANNQFNASEADKNRSWESQEAKIARGFNADEAEKARQFNSAEAQKARDWEAQMSNTAYQRQVADMIAAGLNPAAAHLTNGASTPNGQAASGGSATSGVPNGSPAHSASGGSGGLIGMLASIAGPVLAKVAGSKIMAKASSARDAAKSADVVARETMRAQAAIDKVEAQHASHIERMRMEKIFRSKKYWQSGMPPTLR